jgi:hypothetical protein
MPKLVLMPCRENCTTGGRASTEERVETLKQLLGQDLHDQFMAANRLDLALHAHATHVLQQAGRRLDLPRLD